MSKNQASDSSIRRCLRSVVSLVFLVVVNMQPVVGYALDDPNSSSSPVTTIDATAVSQAAPTAAVSTEPAPAPTPVIDPYVYNEQTGKWDNGTYTWDPATGQSALDQATNYSYNTATGAWDTDEWVLDPTTGIYIPNVNTAQVPEVPSISTAPVTSSAELLKPSAVDSLGPNSAAKIDGMLPGSLVASPIISKLGDSNSDSYFAGFFNASISGNLKANSVSGDASVLFNTLAGNATSGDAFTQATLLNMIQGSWVGAGSAPTLFTADIQGSHFGDLLINPGQINSTGSVPLAVGDLAVVATTNASISNDIKLAAVTGNSTVADNTSAGSATTGDAKTLANVMNLINSSIAANKSFIGVINVLGDLEGDVLLPADITKQLTAANIPSTTLSLPSYSVDTNTTSTINNNILATANSGNATVSNNTQAGDATTGSARTNVTVFNLTGQQIIGSNALLVFVNVLGQWVGFITNTPAGSTTALLGATASGSSVTPASSPSYSLDADSKYYIDNKIDVAATSGNATVRDNTTAGNAKTGSALAGVNVMNITNSNLSFGGWFGALFINIFGNWHGSFGTDTAYGGYSTRPPVSGGGTTSEAISPAILGKTFTIPVVVVAKNKAVAFSAASTNVGGGTDQPKPIDNKVIISNIEKAISGASRNVGTANVNNGWIVRLAGLLTAGYLAIFMARRLSMRTR